MIVIVTDQLNDCIVYNDSTNIVLYMCFNSFKKKKVLDCTTRVGWPYLIGRARQGHPAPKHAKPHIV